MFTKCLHLLKIDNFPRLSAEKRAKNEGIAPLFAEKISGNSLFEISFFLLIK